MKFEQPTWSEHDGEITPPDSLMEPIIPDYQVHVNKREMEDDPEFSPTRQEATSNVIPLHGVQVGPNVDVSPDAQANEIAAAAVNHPANYVPDSKPVPVGHEPYVKPQRGHEVIAERRIEQVRNILADGVE